MLLLIADDNRDAAETLSEVLRQLVLPPVEFLLAFDGRQALVAATGSRTPDAVIMDLEMPVMDGVNAAVEIRLVLGDRAPPLIAASGSADMLDLSSVRSAFDHALLKPLKMDELLALLRPLAQAQAQVTPYTDDQIACALKAS